MPGPAGDDPRAEGGRVEGDEPLLPARVHRPSDLLRMGLGLLALAAVLTIAAFAHGTTAGLEDDVRKGTDQAPALLISLTGLTSSVAVLLVPVAFAVERLVKRDGLRIADGVLAAVLAHGASLAMDVWVTHSAPQSLQEALTKSLPGEGGVISAPVHSYLAPVIAYMTAVGMARRPRWRVVLWCVLVLDAFAVLIAGYSTPFSIAATVLIGWSVAYATLYAVGSPNVRPTGQTLLAGLRRVGFHPTGARREEDPAEGEGGRRYLVTLEDGPPLYVTVVDREQQAHGYFYRAWRRLAMRGLTEPRSLQTLRQVLEQEALLAYAASASGANVPRLIATSELGPDAVMLVYEHVGGHTLDALPDGEVTDELMRGRLAGGGGTAGTPDRPPRPERRRAAGRRRGRGVPHRAARRRDRRGRPGAAHGRGAAADHIRAALRRRAGGGGGGGRAGPRRGRRLPAAAAADRAEPRHPQHAAPAGQGTGAAAARGGSRGLPRRPGGARGRDGPGRRRAPDENSSGPSGMRRRRRWTRRWRTPARRICWRRSGARCC